MERTDGARRLLSSGLGYRLFQKLAGADRLRRWLAANFWRVGPRDRVVDIGCGPGVVIPYLPPGISYVGFDPSLEYIAAARARYGDRPNVSFIHGTVREAIGAEGVTGADVVLCNGVLHHLNDQESLEVLGFARDALKSGGAFRGLEATYLTHQGRFSRWLTGLDRGQHVRTEAAWQELMRAAFPAFHTRIATRLIHLPYIHILLEGRRSG